MNIKRLLFTSAAGIMVVTGAQAADLPTAEPVEYVRVCDAFGTGFFYIPGTDTCLKISGYARYEMHWVGDSDISLYDPADGRYRGAAVPVPNPAIAADEGFNNFTTRARGQVNFDARTMTDLGLLRSYVALRGTIGPTDSGGYSDGFNIDKAWLSLANDSGTLTAGHHGSFFDFFGGSAMNTRIGGDDPTTSTNTLAYTFAVGNGVSASVAVEDKWFRRYGIGAGIYTTVTIFSVSTVTSGNTASVGLYTTGNEGQEIPDFVANIRVDQGWGSAQLMGAVGRVGVAGNPTAGFTPTVLPAADEFGWALGAGLSVGVPGTGISFDVQGTWAEGLVAYSTTGNGALIFDAVYSAPPGGGDATGIDLTETWAIQAALGADVSSNVSVSLDGAYASVDHNGTLRGEDYDTWIVAGTVHWKPVSGLTVSGEVAYESVDADGGAHYIVDDDIWGAMMRINRTF